MPYYVVYRRGEESARAVNELEKAIASAGRLTVAQMEAAVRALEGIREWAVKRVKTAPPYEWQHNDVLLVKALADWKVNSVMVVQKGHLTRIFEGRHLALLYLIEMNFMGTEMLANWLGLTTASLPTDLLTYLLERRGLALHWIEERMKCQIEFVIVNINPA